MSKELFAMDEDMSVSVPIRFLFHRPGIFHESVRKSHRPEIIFNSITFRTPRIIWQSSGNARSLSEEQSERARIKNTSPKPEEYISLVRRNERNLTLRVRYLSSSSSVRFLTCDARYLYHSLPVKFVICEVLI